MKICSGWVHSALKQMAKLNVHLARAEIPFIFAYDFVSKNLFLPSWRNPMGADVWKKATMDTKWRTKIICGDVKNPKLFLVTIFFVVYVRS